LSGPIKAGHSSDYSVGSGIDGLIEGFGFGDVYARFYDPESSIFNFFVDCPKEELGRVRYVSNADQNLTSREGYLSDADSKYREEPHCLRG
jgi:hypothetical protein